MTLTYKGNEASASSRGTSAIGPNKASKTPLSTVLATNGKQIAYAIDALRQEDVSFTVQFLSAVPFEGTTTVAAAFASAVAVEFRRSTLLINCRSSHNLGVPRWPSLLEDFDGALSHADGIGRVQYCNLTSSTSGLKGKSSSILRDALSRAKNSFATVIFDSSAVTQDEDALTLSRFCDGTILVVRAGSTRRELVSWARDKVTRHGGQVIGTVLNGRETYIPRWLYRRL